VKEKRKLNNQLQFFLQRKVLAAILISFIFGTISTYVISANALPTANNDQAISISALTGSPLQCPSPAVTQTSCDPSPTIDVGAECRVDDDCGNSPSCLPPPDECYLYKCISGRCKMERVR